MAQADIGIQRQLNNGILRLSFDRPERKNAITQGIYTALAAAAKLAAASLDSVISTRWLIRQFCVDETMARIALENEHFGRLRQTPQVLTAFVAFLNKARA